MADGSFRLRLGSASDRLGIIYIRIFRWLFIATLIVILEGALSASTAIVRESTNTSGVQLVSLLMQMLAFMAALGYWCRYLIFTPWPIVQRVRDVQEQYSAREDKPSDAEIAKGVHATDAGDLTVSALYLVVESYYAYALASAAPSPTTLLLLLIGFPLLDFALAAVVSIGAFVGIAVPPFIVSVCKSFYVGLRRRVVAGFKRIGKFLKVATDSSELDQELADAEANAKERRKYAVRRVKHYLNPFILQPKTFGYANLFDLVVPALMFFTILGAAAIFTRSTDLSVGIVQEVRRLIAMQISADVRAASASVVPVSDALWLVCWGAAVLGGGLATFFAIKKHVRQELGIAYRLFFRADLWDGDPPDLVAPEELRSLAAGNDGKLAALQQRARTGEPRTYLSGSCTFLGRTFQMDRRVYSPNVETETLANRVIAYLHDNTAKMNPLVLDVGTGCGNLAISIKLAVPAAKVIAIDVHADALAVAQMNAVAHSADIEFVEADLLTSVNVDRPDVIVADLPYGSAEYLLRSNTLVSQSHMPPIATFTAGLLSAYERLLEQIDNRKWTGCLILFEVGPIPEIVVRRELGHVLKSQWFYRAAGLHYAYVEVHH